MLYYTSPNFPTNFVALCIPRAQIVINIIYPSDSVLLEGKRCAISQGCRFDLLSDTISVAIDTIHALHINNSFEVYLKQ